MDSGSGSLQSSSGGDEEYDSHHHQQQPLLFPPPPLFFNNNLPLPSSSSSSSSSSALGCSSSSFPFHYQNHHLLHPPPNFYDFPSNYNFDPDSSNTFVSNLDVLRSEPTHFKNASTLDGSTQNQIQIRSTPSSSAGALHPKVTTKKRTRASRRAPTTVLTTDTTNFRAMVQEFTGIPSPPFTAGGSSSYSRRFDLFGLVRTSNSTATSLETSGLGVYPSRSKTQVTNDDNVVQQAAAQVGGAFSFESLSGHEFNYNSKEVREGNRHLETAHHNIHGSTTTTSQSQQQLVSAATLQNDETWRGSSRGSTAVVTATAAATRSNNNNNNAANCYNIMA